MDKPQQLKNNRNVSWDWFNNDFETIKKRIKPHFHGEGFNEFVSFIKHLCQNNFTYTQTKQGKVYEYKIRNVFDSEGNIEKKKLKAFFENLGDTLEAMHEEKYEKASVSLEACFDEPNDPNDEKSSYAAHATKMHEFVEDFLLPCSNVHGYSKVLFEHFAKSQVKRGNVNLIQQDLKNILSDFDRQESARDKEYGIQFENDKEQLGGDDLSGLFSSEKIARLHELRAEYLKSQGE